MHEWQKQQFCAGLWTSTAQRQPDVCLSKDPEADTEEEEADAEEEEDADSEADAEEDADTEEDVDAEEDAEAQGTEPLILLEAVAAAQNGSA